MQSSRIGEEILLGGFFPLTLTLKWTTAHDFDLAAVFETREGGHGLIFFGESGEKKSFPYIELDEDRDAGRAGEEKAEKIVISRLTDMNHIWIFCWEYEKIQEGENACFDDVRLHIDDASGGNREISPGSVEKGNVICFADIDNTDPENSVIRRLDRVGKLKGLHNISELLEIVFSPNVG